MQLIVVNVLSAPYLLAKERFTEYINKNISLHFECIINSHIEELNDI